VVDAAGVCITQRTHPALALVRPAIADGGLRVEAPGLAPIHLGTAGPPVAVRVWGDVVEAADLGDRAADWISAAVGVRCRLVHMPGRTRRPVASLPREQARVSFADAYPFLVLSAASLDDLNARLAVPVPMNRFRPNLVVGGGAPFAEDAWGRIRAGGIELSLLKPCARCVLTTVDQRRGRKDGTEPLRTLATFRRVDGEVLFGMNAVHHGTGRLAVGEPVALLEGRPPEIGGR
jgi:uncharacterized protein YcbX